jgi:hypothetical protein
VQSHEPDRATLVMNVQAGARPSIVDVQLTQLDAEEQGLLDDRPALRTGGPYDKAAVERELQRWTDRMRGRNYYEARASHGVLFPPDGAVLSVSVTRGPHVTVAFTGDSLTENERDRLVPIRAEASADEDLLEDSARAIEGVPARAGLPAGARRLHPHARAARRDDHVRRAARPALRVRHSWR